MNRLSVLLIFLCQIGLAQVPENPHGPMDRECSECHVTTSWKEIKTLTDFKHQRFVPEGVHTQLDCKACHKSMTFQSVPQDCAACHQDIHQGQLGFDCSRCHDPTSWENRQKMAELHQGTLFPLQGAHTNLDCSSCHTEQVPAEFVNTPAECRQCHISQFESTTEPNHHEAGFSTSCDMCHFSNHLNWNQAEFNHDTFSLTGAHASLDCASCHTQGYQGTPPDCFACHQEDYQATTDPSHSEQAFPTDCTLCHSTQAWEPASFNHDASAFPLTGAHTMVDCSACHQTSYSGTPSECNSCHEPDFLGVNDPSHVDNQFDRDCTQCHTTNAWEPASFDHAMTNFPLTGAHVPLSCISCHDQGYQATPADCIDCHEADFQATTDPSHVENQFDNDCTQCHTTNAWEPATFDHELTNFPLTGAHVPLSCISCHDQGYQTTPTECFACHEQDFNTVDDPSHVENNFDQDCTQCHTTNAWEPATFDHELTNFPLTGAHVPLSCISCHDQGYQATPTECFACHEQDFNTVDDPSHVENNFDQDCTQCHTTNAWEPATFDHGLTNFPLTGAHVPLSCISCHDQGYQATPTECFSCHEPDFNTVDDPSHVENNFDQDCTQCHTTNAWEPATFDHAMTNFPLTGAHVPLSCISCHDQGYQATPTECFACHESDFNTVDDPSHVENNFDQDCTQCHTTNAWEPATFDHELTNFPLTGAHVPLSCISCHDQGYQATPTECFACHEPDFNTVDDPSHVENNFDQDCTQCHTTNAWEPATFDHAMTNFPLTGAHVPLSCISCHDQGYQATPTECFACHEPDFNTVDDPSHVENNFDHDCTQCHTTNAWEPATFDHELTNFPLTGAHVPLSCISCHDQGYQATPTECFACHEQDFNTVDDPSHVENNFDHDCTQCHTTNAWEPATFDHELTNFPLTGAHVPVSCIDCHDQGYQNTSPECFSCHENAYNTANDPDHQAAAFPVSCQDCHTTSAWEPATFVHNFPIYSGSHNNEWDQCIDCHVGAVYTTFECIFCHTADEMNPEHDEVPDYVFASPACYNCHPTGEE